MRFVVVTGMSGGGKRTALKMLEDIGFYCVDNLPEPLVEKFVEVFATPDRAMTKVALGLDVRSDKTRGGVEKTLDLLREKGHTFEILFMDANEQVIIRRYKESRRLHPLAEDGRIEDGIRRERSILEGLRKKADYVIDTSNLLTRELKEELDRIFIKGEEYNSLMINIVSFGFKNGILSDADLVFDVRFLPNPFYIDELKQKTGNDKEVQDYVMSFEEAHVFMDKLTELINFLIPNYIKEGKYQLVIGIGCTGGKHRSVTLANALYDRLKDKGSYGIKISHRDVDKKRL